MYETKVEEHLYPQILQNSSCLFLGGANANPMTKISMGYEGKDDQRLQPRKDFFIPYRFYGVSDIDEVKRFKKPFLRTTTEKLGEIERFNWGFKDLQGDDEEKVYNCDLIGHEPINDYLLITKMPNIFSDTQDHNIVMVDGAHGMGTRAFHVLLNSKEVLRDINAHLKGKRFFQILLNTKVELAEGYHKSTQILYKGKDNPIFHEIESITASRFKEAHQYALKRSEAEGVFEDEIRTLVV